MKPATVLLSYAIGAAAKTYSDGVGNIRAAGVLHDQKQEGAVLDKFSSLSRRGGKKEDTTTSAAARHERSRRKIAKEDIHKTIIKNMGLTTNTKATQDLLEEDRDRNDKERSEKGQQDEDNDRKLKKTKSDKGGMDKGGMDKGGKGGKWNGGGGNWNDGKWNGGGTDWNGGKWNGGGTDGNGGKWNGGGTDWDDDDWIENNGDGSGGSDDWNRGSSDWNRGSGDHANGSGDWNRGSGDLKEDGGGWNTEVYSGKTGKKNRSGTYSGSGSGKSGKEISSGDGGESCGEYANVEVVNVSYLQSFSEIFIMTATEEVTEKMPIFVFGNKTNTALATLAKDADANEIQNRYMNRDGVEMVKIFDDFDYIGVEEKFLRGGTRATFKVRTSGYGERLSIAVGLPFTNDGAVVLQGARIYDGADYWVAPIDTGAEANIQTCWSVAAKREDFPKRSVCSESDNTSENANDIPGEGFVSMHRGMQDLDAESDLQDVLQLKECEELNIDENSNARFATYFYEVGFDDDFLLCSNAIGTCNPRDDQDFINTLEDLDDLTDDRYVQLARESEDFDDFCANITAVNNELNDLFKTLEPVLFDWRNAVMQVKISCGWHDDESSNGDGNGWHDDGWSNGGYQNITTLPESLQN